MKIIAALLLAALGGFFVGPAAAFDHGFDPNSPVTQWFDTLMRPDMEGSPCCGAGDAYEVAVIEEGGVDGHGPDWKVQVTDGEVRVFPDGTRRTPLPNGKIITVPASKVTKPRQGNPTKTAWLFMSVYQSIIAGDDGSYTYNPDVGQSTVGTLYCLVPLPPSF